jgi:hypothetical protein
MRAGAPAGAACAGGGVTFPLLLVFVVSRVLPRALLCAAIAALCHNSTPARVLRSQLGHAYAGRPLSHD